MALPTALPSSTATRHRTQRYWSTSTHLVCVPLVVQARTCYSSCFWSMALSSSLLLSGFHVACTSTSLGAISLPCLLPCSGLLSRQRLIHSTWRYFAGAVLIWYTVSRFYGFVFVFLSSSSSSSFSSSSSSSFSSSSSYILYYCSSPSFLFCSLSGFHLECTSNSLGATSLWPAGLPKAIEYFLL